MKTRFFSLITILFLSLLSLSSVFAQGALPDGVTARIGKGKITGNVAVSPSGSHIAVPSLTNIWIYDSTGTEIEMLTRHTNRVTEVAFSSDGTKIASGGWDRTVHLWNWNGSVGTLQHTLTGHTAPITSLAFQPDKNTVASGSADGNIRLWNATTGALQHTLAAHAGSVNGLAFSPSDELLVSGSYDETIAVWDLSSPTDGSSSPTLQRTLTGHTDSVESVAFHPDGKRIASGSWDTTARLWKVSTGESVRTFPGHTLLVESVAFSPGGNLLVTGSSDKSIRTWNVGTGAPVQTFTGHNLAVTSVTVDTNNVIISGSADATVRRWDTSSNTSLGILVRHTGGILSLAYGPDGNSLVTGSSDGTLRLWDTATARQSKIFRETSTAIQSVAFGRDDQAAGGGADTIASVGSWDTSVNLSYTDQRSPVDVPLIIGSPILSLALGPDANTLAVGFNNGSILLAQIGQSPLTFSSLTPSFASPILSVAFNPDGTRLATGEYDGTVRLRATGLGSGRISPPVLGLDELQLPHSFNGHTGAVTSVAFSPDDTKIASASFDNTIRLWNVTTGTLENTLIGHRNIVKSVAFNQDGTRLVSGGVDSAIILWNTTTGRALTTLIGHAGTVHSVAFNPNGTEFATGSDDGTVLLWNINNVPLAPQLVSQFPEPQGLINADPVVMNTALLANYPNPFNPETWIPYQLAAPADVNISIHSSEGTLVRTLNLGTQAVGVYESRARAAYWDGKNQTGEPVASGVYFYTLTAGEFTATRKMLILK